MDRLNLCKHGFVRIPTEDFSDDGNRFKMYDYKGLRVSYLRDGDDFYISPRGCWDGRLSYEEYSKLDHYRSLDKLNGTANVTDTDVDELVNDIEAYMKEYLDVVNHLEAVNDEDMKLLFIKVWEHFDDQLNDMDMLLSNNIPRLMDKTTTQFGNIQCSYRAVRSQKNRYADLAKHPETMSQRDRRVFVQYQFNKLMNDKYSYNSFMEALR